MGMRTYKVQYKLKNGHESAHFIPSFSKEEAEVEFRYTMKIVYGEDPKIVSVEELPRNGEVVERGK